MGRLSCWLHCIGKFQKHTSLFGRRCTKVEVFVDKAVRGRARTERGNVRSDATKKRDISRTLFSIDVFNFACEIQKDS